MKIFAVPPGRCAFQDGSVLFIVMTNLSLPFPGGSNGDPQGHPGVRASSLMRQVTHETLSDESSRKNVNKRTTQYAKLS